MAAQLFGDVSGTRKRERWRSSVSEEFKELQLRQYGMRSQSGCQDFGKWVFYSVSSVSVRFS